MSKAIIDQIKTISHFINVDLRHIKKLQKILKEHHKRNVPLKEAEEVARELVGFYECLADGRSIKDQKTDEGDEQ